MTQFCERVVKLEHQVARNVVPKFRSRHGPWGLAFQLNLRSPQIEQIPEGLAGWSSAGRPRNTKTAFGRNEIDSWKFL